MRTLYVVTHPEATHHVEGLVGGWFDSALTKRGESDAAAIAAELQRRIPEGAVVDVVSSDLKRTTQTAEAIAGRLGVRFQLHDGLREASYGEAEGRPQAWLDRRFIPSPATGERMRHWDGVPGSETKLQLVTRVYAALDDALASEATHQVIVTHGFAGQFVLAGWIMMPIESAGYVSFRLTPGGISVLREDAFFHNRQVTSLNEVSHLLG
ncbi:MAG: histidine phosphatase family protein [Terracoccus sp.]